MAITKLMHIKPAKKGSPHQTLKKAIAYVINPEKSYGYVGGNSGITTEEIFAQFLETKRIWEKTDGRQGYHFVFSFSPDEQVPAELMYEILQEFSEVYLKDAYDCVFTVHQNTEHMHGHLLFNSVNRETGYKYRYERGDWKQVIQPVTDRICMQHGLKPLTYGPETVGTSYREHMDEKGRRLTWRELIRRDLDQLLRNCHAYEELLQKMQEKGYVIRRGHSQTYGPYLAIRPRGAKRAVRSYQLGTGYQPEELQMRIRMQNETGQKKPFFAEIRSVHCQQGRLLPKRYLKGLQIVFIRKLFRNEVLHRYQTERSYSDVDQIRRLSRQCRYLVQNHYFEREQLQERKQQIELQMNLLKNQRRRLKREQAEGFGNRVREHKIVQIKEELQGYRREQKLILQLQETIPAERMIQTEQYREMGLRPGNGGRNGSGDHTIFKAATGKSPSLYGTESVCQRRDDFTGIKGGAGDGR